MTEVTIRDAKIHLSRLIQLALNGEDVVIGDGKRLLVKLVALPGGPSQRVLGAYPEAVIHLAEDFDEPLAEFAEYMS